MKVRCESTAKRGTHYFAAVAKSGPDRVAQRRSNLAQDCVSDVVSGAFAANKAPKPLHLAAPIYVQ